MTVGEAFFGRGEYKPESFDIALEAVVDYAQDRLVVIPLVATFFINSENSDRA